MNIDRLLSKLSLSKDKWLRILLSLSKCKKIRNKRKKTRQLKKKIKKTKKTLNLMVLKSKMMLRVLVKNLLKNLKNKVKDPIFQSKTLI